MALSLPLTPLPPERAPLRTLNVPMTNAQDRYGTVAKTLHWLIFGLFVFMFALAWYMTRLPDGLDKFQLYNLHKSIGLTLLLLALLRLLWRLISPPPPLPASLATWEVNAARTSHLLLYALMFLQPLSGLIASMTSGFPTVIYGLLNLPKLLPTNEPLSKAFWAVHYYSAIAILVVVAVHAGAALRHHFVQKDDVLRRMLPFATLREVRE